MSMRDALIQKIDQQPEGILWEGPLRPPAKVKFVKVNGYTVGVTDQPIDEVALKKALDEFP